MRVSVIRKRRRDKMKKNIIINDNENGEKEEGVV